MLNTMGTDAEFFCSVNDAIIALQPGMIEGKKAKPHVINKTYDLGIQLDNVLAETTFAPARDGQEFRDLCLAAKADTAAYLHGKGFDPVYKSSHIFNASELLSPHARTAGCEPDYPAVEGDPCSSLDMQIFQVLRTGSGHIHFGLDHEISRSDIIQYVRGLDRCLGAALCVHHNDPMRRKLYGQAGRFRIKDYPGFEYRTPDNFWYDNAGVYAPLIWEAAEEMFSIPLTDPVWDKVNEHHKSLAKAINLGLVPEIIDNLKSFDFPHLEIE